MIITRQKGFTLIELIVVIIILGVLAVTATPKFINLSSDARASSLAGLKGPMATAMTLSHVRSQIDNVADKAQATIKINGEDVDMVYGYPAAKFSTSWSRLLNGEFGEVPYDNADLFDWMRHNPGGAATGIYFMPRGYTHYFRGTATEKTKLTTIKNGC